MKKPSGLKLYPGLLALEEVDELLGVEEYQDQKEAHVQLFRLYGSFGSKPAEEPREWMLSWGEQMVERGLFEQRPNQYRVCDWVGDLCGQFKWHIDNKRHGEAILSIALTDGRAIGFRPVGKGREVYEVELNRGDAYVMAGASRWEYEHSILPRGRSRSGGKSLVMSYKRA